MPYSLQPAPRVESPDAEFAPVDALTPTAKCVAYMAGVGTFLAAAQATLSRTNVGAFGPLRQFGGTVVQFGEALRQDFSQNWLIQYSKHRRGL